MSSPAASERKRSKVACEPCRHRKRKCDGSKPCRTCIRLEYDCYYAIQKRKRRTPSIHRNEATPQTAIPSPLDMTSQHEETSRNNNAQDRLDSLEANSGAAFVRRLALALDPANAPRMHLFAWNTFLGARQMDLIASTPQSITALLSERAMENFAAVYFDKIDPYYGFINRPDIERRIKHRWSSWLETGQSDSVLCGIAALGCLFTQQQSTGLELGLVNAAKIELERTLSETPNIDTITGWTLRVAYLRMTSPPHTAWMASCILMHMVEAAGLHCEPVAGTILQAHINVVNDELRRRIFGVAQHLNIWTSFDLGRSRVVLESQTTLPPSTRPGDYTNELLVLLPYSEMLDPSRVTSSEELATALNQVLELSRAKPPAVLAQCNLVLCIYRRLRAKDTAPRGKVLDRILDLTARAIHSAQALLDAFCPWHHVANVPFQIICTLLAIDTPASLGQLEGAMQTLENVVAVYSSEPLQEAFQTASLIVLLHQRRKESDLAKLSHTLKRHPVAPLPLTKPGRVADLSIQSVPDGDISGFLWLDDTIADITNLQNFAIDDFLLEGLY